MSKVTRVSAPLKEQSFLYQTSCTDDDWSLQFFQETRELWTPVYHLNLTLLHYQQYGLTIVETYCNLLRMLPWSSAVLASGYRHAKQLLRNNSIHSSFSNESFDAANMSRSSWTVLWAIVSSLSGKAVETDEKLQNRTHCKVTLSPGRVNLFVVPERHFVLAAFIFWGNIDRALRVDEQRTVLCITFLVVVPTNKFGSFLVRSTLSWFTIL